MNTKFLTIFFFVILSSMTLFNGCCPIASSSHIDIRGIILNIDPAQKDSYILGSLYIEGALYDDTAYDKARVTINRSTKLLQKENATTIPISFNTLQVGMIVEVTFTGAILESYPIQATAQKLLVLSDIE